MSARGHRGQISFMKRHSTNLDALADAAERKRHRVQRLLARRPRHPRDVLAELEAWQAPKVGEQ